MTEKTILDALAKLDVSNDAHWTEDGLPRIETVRLFAGDNKLTRDMLTLTAPSFTRQAPSLPQGSEPVTDIEGKDNVQLGSGENVSDDAGKSQDSVQEPEQEASVETPQEPTAAERLANAATAKAKADKEYQEAQQAMDAEIDRAVKSGAQETLAQQISAYHRVVKAGLQARAEQKQRLRDANINLKDLIPSRAPIDAALERKRARGTQRPVMPRR